MSAEGEAKQAAEQGPDDPEKMEAEPEAAEQEPIASGGVGTTAPDGEVAATEGNAEAGAGTELTLGEASVQAAQAGGAEATAAAKTPEAGGGGPPAAVAAPDAEGSGDEEAAADELEEKLEAAAPASDTDETDTEPPEPESMRPEPEPVLDVAEAGGTTTPTESEPAPEASSDTAASESESPAEAAAPELAEAEEATEPHEPEVGVAAAEASEGAVDDGAAEAEPAELSPAEKGIAMAAMAEGGSDEPSGGGGGGSAVPDRPPIETPEVATLDPQTALAQAASAPPAALAATLGGVKAAVGKKVGEQHDEQTASPPTVKRPAGRGAKVVETRTTAGGQRVEKAKEGQERPTPASEPVTDPTTPPPVDTVPEPPVRSTPEGELTEDGARTMQGSISSMPTSDPELNARAGPPPRVKLEGNADPAHVDDQKVKLQDGVRRTTAEGRADAAAYMGQHDIYDDQPEETLHASIGSGHGAGSTGDGGGGAGPRSAGGGADLEAASIIAQEEKGAEISAAVVAAKADMSTKKREHAVKVSEERAKSKEDIAGLEKAGAEEQAAVRKGAKEDVKKQRSEWTSEQETAVEEADKQADDEVKAGKKQVDDEKRIADDKAQAEIRRGDEDAANARRKAEQEARRKKQEAEEESSGLFGWLASKAKAFFNKVKAAISAAFDAARKLVKAAINKAKELAAKAIEAARRVIVAAIKAVGDALIAIGDRLLKHFPALREKFRKAITAAVNKAVDTVNKLAEKLNQAIQKALDLLGAALDAALALLEKGLLAAVNAVSSVVEGALKFANSVVQALAMFARLIADVASGPMQWLKNLGAGVVDGIRTHLWKAFKSAVQEWFNAKVQEVVGVGAAVWDLLVKGGITVAEIGRMAWEGIKAMIPMAVIQILVEKLVSLIVPAAGAVKIIIEGLQAAWGSVGRILQAFSKFFAFLKSVKSGNAGPPFAVAVAAAAVAVIDFIANWLLRKLAKGAKKVGGKLEGIARRLKGKKRAGASRREAKSGAKVKPVGKPRRKESPKRKETAKNKDRRKKQERLDRAVEGIKPQLAKLARKGVRGIFLKARLLYWRARYRLTRLDLKEPGKQAQFTAKVNPEKVFVLGLSLDAYERDILEIVREVGWEALQRRTAGRRTPLEQSDKLRDQPYPREGGGTVEMGGRRIEHSKYHWAKEPPLAGTGKRPFAPSYTALADRLKDIPDATLAEHLKTLARGGTLPLGTPGRADIEMLGSVMFQMEPARSMSAVVSSMQVTQLMGEAGGMTKERAFKAPPEMSHREGLSYQGEYPMSTGRAASSSRQVSEALGMPGTGPSYVPRTKKTEGTVEGGQTMIRKELALFEKWWAMKYPGDKLYARDRATIRDRVREAVDEFYDLRAREGGGIGPP